MIGPPGTVATHFEGLDDWNPGGEKAGELEVKIRPPTDLPGSDDHSNTPGFKGVGRISLRRARYAAALSRLALRSRLLFIPTICSNTCPLLKTNRVGMAVTRY